MNTLENNKQFAKFLGLTHKAIKGGFMIKGIVVKYEKLNFHNDWNSLMEVVEKIENLQNCRFDFQINQHSSRIYDHEKQKFIVEINRLSKIESVYTTSLSFIKWYNLNK